MTSFRPLRIDIDRPMMIVRQHIEDAEVRPVKDCGTGMESNEEEEEHIKIAIETAKKNRSRLQAEIPTPAVSIVPDYDQIYKDDFHRSSSQYLRLDRYSSFTETYDNPKCRGMVDYDMDEEDEKWLASLFKVSVPIFTENPKTTRKLINFDVPSDLPYYPADFDNGHTKHKKRPLKNGYKRTDNNDNYSFSPNSSDMEDSDSSSSDEENISSSTTKFTDQLSNFQCEIFELTISSYEHTQNKYYPLNSIKSLQKNMEFVSLETAKDDFSTFISNWKMVKRMKEFFIECSKLHSPISKDSYFQRTYDYWIEKRKSRKNSLIRRYQPPPDVSDSSPYVAFRPNSDTKNKISRRSNFQSLRKLKLIRQQFEKGRTLLEMTKRREKLKREYISNLQKLFDLSIARHEKYMLDNDKNEVRPMKRVKLNLYDKKEKREKDGEKEKMVREKKDKTYSPLFTSSDHISKNKRVEIPTPSLIFAPLQNYLLDNEQNIEYFDHYPGHIHNTQRNLEHKKYWGNITINNHTFRGRARVSRGGRIVFDKYSSDEDEDDEDEDGRNNNSNNNNSSNNNTFNKFTPFPPFYNINHQKFKKSLNALNYSRSSDMNNHQSKLSSHTIDVNTVNNVNKTITNDEKQMKDANEDVAFQDENNMPLNYPNSNNNNNNNNNNNINNNTDEDDGNSTKSDSGQKKLPGFQQSESYLSNDLLVT